MMGISLIIVTYNNLINKIQNHCSRNINLVWIIVNNNINKKMHLNKPHVYEINSLKNLGFGGGGNVGVRKAIEMGAEYFLILNDDVLIEKRCIDQLLKTIKSNEKIGIVGPKLYMKDEIIWSCGGVIDKVRYSGGLIGYGESDKGQYNDITDVDYIPGAAMLIKKGVFEKIGFFDERYFLYYEDVDLCFRAKKAGFRIVVNPKAIAYHEHSASVGINSPLKQYYMARNHLLFTQKYAPVNVKLHELLRLPKTLYEHYLNKENAAILGIQDYFFRRFNQRKSF